MSKERAKKVEIPELAREQPEELTTEQAGAIRGGDGTTIGSATGGAGAGKAKFNEFQITKLTDTISP